MMKEDPDRKPDVFKIETGLTSSDNDEGHTDPCHEDSNQILSASPIKQNPNFLEDLVDGFAMATKSESQNNLIPPIKVETTGIEDSFAGPCHEGSSQILSASPIKQNPNFLHDLVDGFSTATKSESHDVLITTIKVENTENEDSVAEFPADERRQILPETVPTTSFGVNSSFNVEGVTVKLEDSSIEGPCHESNRRITNVSSSMWNPFVRLERIDLNLVDVCNSGTKSTSSHDLPSLRTQIKVENTEDENPLAGPCHESVSQISSVSSSKWNPFVVLERIDLDFVDAVNSRTKSTFSHDLPNLMSQIKVENTEDEIPLAGPSVDGRLLLSPVQEHSTFEKGSRFSLEGVGIKRKDRPSKGSVQKKGVSKFYFAKGGDMAHPALLLNVTTFKLTDCSGTVTRGDATDLDNDASVIGYHGGKLVSRSTFLSPKERSGPSKNDSGVQAERSVGQVSEQQSSFLNYSSKLMRGKKLQDCEKRILCSICTKQVLLKCLKSHLRSHFDEKPLSCKQCPGRFKTKGHLISHLKSHSDERLYACEQCSARFKTKGNLRRHFAVHADEKPFICDQCPSGFKSKEELKVHSQAHRSERPFTCSQCQLRFKWRQSLNHHLQAHSNERPFPCAKCLMRFKSRGALSRHLRSHSDERPFSCEQCLACFKSKIELAHHIRRHSDEKPYPCKKCTTPFKTLWELNSHLRTHSDKKPYSCKLCTAHFKVKGALDNHLRRHSDERPYSCEQCSAHFKTKADLIGHLLKHSNERPYSCKQCTACFKSMKELTRHLQRHSDERPYSCKQCSARFKTKADLVGHLQKHSNERPYSCKRCPGCFKSKKALNLHLQRHSEERPYSCEHCTARFIAKTDLTAHLRRHSDERPYSCKLCPKRFKSNQSLKKHSCTHSNERPILC